ncbi:MAG TPA: hypothetical protein VI029_11515 [Mycobacterium sp.]
MPVRAILTSHSVAVTRSNIVQRLVHIAEARTPRLLNRPYEDFHPESRRIARFVPRPLDYRRTLPTLTAGANFRPQTTAGVGRDFGGLRTLNPNE